MGAQKYSVGWVLTERWPYRNVMASTRIRCFDIIKYLKEHGTDTGLYRAFKKYDIVVFQKSFYEKHYRLARKLRARGTKIVLDVNVNYFEKTGETLQVTEKHIEALHRFLELTDTIFTSSSYLTEIAGKYHPDVHYIPEHVSTSGSYPPRKLNDPVKLVYCGYAIKADSVLLIKDVLRKLAESYNIELMFVCEKDPQLDLPVKASFIKYDHNKLAEILRQGDIKIAPRKLDNSYDLGHSFTKIGYPMSVGLPVVASPVPSYKGSPAMIAESPEDWFDHISFLINTPEEYTKLSGEGILFVKEHYSIDKIGGIYKELFEKVINA